MHSNNSPAPIRVGITGYGLSGRVFHAPFVAANPSFSLDFIVTSDAGRAALARQEHPGVNIVASADELANHYGELDLVVLAGPPHTHLEQGMAALDAGVAVIVDKPFAPSVRDAEALIERAERQGRPLMVFQNRRWDGDFLTARKVVESGELGEIFLFESSFEHWAPTATDTWKDQSPVSQAGGVTYDLGSHLVDQALVLFGPVREANADIRCVRPGGGNDDVGFVRLVHESGVHSHLLMSRLGSQPGPRFRILGTRGSFVSWGLDGQEPALASGMTPDDPAYGVTPESGWGTAGVAGDGTGLRRVPTERGDYPAFYAAAAAAVRGEGPAPVDPRDALEVVRLIEHLQAG